MFWRILTTALLAASLPAHAIIGVEEIAQALIQTSKYGDPAYTGFKSDGNVTDLQFVMRVPLAMLNKIEKFGFLNQYQTKRSNGSLTHHGRTMTESEMAGIQLPMEPKTLRPKYGTVHMDFADGKTGTYSSIAYGEVAFVFGKHILSRTTWTPTDSLGTTNQTRPLSYTPRLTGHTFTLYPEAQVWGDLDLSDVAFMVVDSGSYKHKEALLKFAESNGLEIYETKGGVGDTTAVLKPENLELLGKFSGEKWKVPTTELLQKDLKSGASGPLLHWLSIIDPGLIPSGYAAVSLWGSAWGVKKEYENDTALEFRDARENTVKGLNFLYEKSETRYALKAAIVRYFRNAEFIAPEDVRQMEQRLEEDPGKEEVIKWIAEWERRASSLSEGDKDYSSTVKMVRQSVKTSSESEAVLKVIDKPETSTDPKTLFSNIRVLLKEIRHGETEELQRLALGKLKKILTNTDTQRSIAQEFASTRRLAQVIFRHSKEFPKSFLNAFEEAVSKLDDRSGAHERALKSCRKIIKGGAAG